MVETGVFLWCHTGPWDLLLFERGGDGGRAPRVDDESARAVPTRREVSVKRQGKLSGALAATQDPRVTQTRSRTSSTRSGVSSCLFSFPPPQGVSCPRRKCDAFFVRESHNREERKVLLDATTISLPMFLTSPCPADDTEVL